MNVQNFTSDIDLLAYQMDKIAYVLQYIQLKRPSKSHKWTLA